MPVETQSKPSFTPYRKWGMSLNLGLLVAVVFAVVVMVNYLGSEFFIRVPVGARSINPLSLRTVKFLGSLTNQVKVTVYFDKDDSLYGLVTDLLKEYRQLNPKISVQYVDYKRDPATADQLHAKYPFLGNANAKNLVIFDCGGRFMFVPGDALTQVSIEATGDKDTPYRRKLIGFNGERAFTAMLLAVTSLKPFNAYLVQGHGEAAFEDNDLGKAPRGYRKFTQLLQENMVLCAPISLLGTNPIPADCSLLIVAGPQTAFDEGETNKIDRYLMDGGRMLVLLRTNYTGIEDVLAKWGVAVGHSIVADPDHTPERASVGSELIASALVNPLMGFGLDFRTPRPVGKARQQAPAADAPQVEQLACSGPKSFLTGSPEHQQVLPLGVALEKGAIKNVVTERGTTRMVVLGDASCFSNELLDHWKNQDFASYLINWLLDRPQLLEGISPQKLKEFKIVMTRVQMRSAQWLLLGGLPGGVLLLGGLVWLRRRR